MFIAAVASGCHIGLCKSRSCPHSNKQHVHVQKAIPNIKTVYGEHFPCTVLDTGDGELAEPSYLVPGAYNPASIDLNK